MRRSSAEALELDLQVDDGRIAVLTHPQGAYFALFEGQGRPLGVHVGARHASGMAEPTQERTIDERVARVREGLTLLADYL